MLLRLPLKFWFDHMERELATPTEIRITRSHVYVSADDPALDSLLDDAKYYSDPYGPGANDPEYRGLRLSARATVKAIEVRLARAQPAD